MSQTPIVNSQASLVLTEYFPTSGIFPSRDGGGTSFFLGEIGTFAGTFVPAGLSPSGQLLPISQNTAIFSLLGTTYGGNGQTNFALPNVGGETMIGTGQGPGLSAETLGVPVGASNVTLSRAQTAPDNGGTSQPFNDYQPSLPITYEIALQGVFPSQGGGSTPLDTLGMIMAFAGNFNAGGYVACDGQLLSIAQNNALFALIGTTYGGDGFNTFALPDLRGRTIIGASVADPVGTMVGQQTVSLSNAQTPNGPGLASQPFDNRQPSLALEYLIATQGIFPSRDGGGQDGTTPLLGQIVAFAGTFVPGGWALCNGALLPISQNQALFSVLGTTYGGDGKTTFALPDLRDRTVVAAASGLPVGTAFGANSVTIDNAQLPPTVSSGQTLTVSGGEIINDILVLNGGTLVVSGGTATNAVVASGGLAVVSSGATASGTTISGGRLVLSNGALTGAASAAISFAGSGGVLEIDGTAMPSNAILNFALGDTIDLPGLAFNSLNYSGGVLTLLQNGIAVGLLNVATPYSANLFVVSPDGSGGDEVMVLPAGGSGYSVKVNFGDGSSTIESFDSLGKEIQFNSYDTNSVIISASAFDPENLNGPNGVAQFTNSYNSGLLTQQTGTLHNGSTYTELFDSQGHETQINFYSNGVIFSASSFDPENLNGANGVAQYTNSYSSGLLTQQNGTLHNGTTYVELFDSQGHETQINFYSNGVIFSASGFDPENLNGPNGVAQFTNSYNAGLLVQQIGTLHNGSTYTELFNSQGHEIQIDYYFNGIIISASGFDPENLNGPNGVAQFTNSYNSGLLTQQIGTLHNGSTYTELFDSQGHETQIDYYSNGVIFSASGFDPETLNGPNGVAQFTNSYNAGLLTQQTGTFHNGSTYTELFDSQGHETQINFYSNGVIFSASGFDPEDLNGTNGVAQFTNSYNSGLLTQQNGTLHNGSTYVELFDSQGHETQINNYGPNGIITSASGFDPENLNGPNGVAQFTNSYNSIGQLTQQVGVLHNGSPYTITF